jgi:hypothetical protein
VEDEHFDLLAASLRADASDTQALLEALAAKLEAALPNACVVERKATRLLSSTKRVDRLTVKLGDDAFALSVSGGGARAERRKTVGGIAIRNEELSLDDWLRGLEAALRTEAERSEAARMALQRLLG